MGIVDVELRDLRALARADVADGERDRDARAGPSHVEVLVREAGVREAVAERKERGDLVRVVPAVSDLEAFGEGRVLALARPRPLGDRRRGNGGVARRERLAQPAARLGVTEAQ